MNADPRLQGVTSGFNPNFPQYLLKVDLAKAAKLGVDLDKAMETLQAYIGSFYSSNFIRFGQMYKVMIQASPEYRMNPEDLYRLYAKNNDGNVVPYSNFMTMDRVFGPSQITRYNMFTSALITGEGEGGISSGKVIQAVEEISKEVLPRGYDVEWSGITREEKDSGGQTILISESVCCSCTCCWRHSMKVCCCLSLSSFRCLRESSVLISSCNWPDLRTIFMHRWLWLC